ncbi:pyrroline-5-carboxylate reductase [Hoeflea sp. YIM 152468]|uniref:pyrroline-5-carboxylate reductase n=1 Tax=Hoeflea sp. YIM 152468 TaxID=3031759 RepID=UPI0023DA3DF8|nr:pyrroline-5-carboxylate reductase [Hoeflea sp. YIM 152468]MDF1609677.1 pyrroline-5-carboxylate reductase [Hoeflea sp. YIM 152468]
MISIDRPLVLVGAGNMGGAMLNGWLDAGMDPATIVVLDPTPSETMAKRLASAGVQCVGSAPDGMTAGVLMLAVKPQIMDDVLPGLTGLVGPQTVSLSVAAGKTIAYFEARLGGAVVRTIPNTPAMVGRGITGAVANPAVTAEARAEIDRLLSVCGPVEWVEDEALIDAITAVSGSGPAYVFYLAECMAEAGRKCGLPADLAMRLARATVSGAGELMHRSPDGAATLRQNVTSPNGTTAAALAVLMADDGIQPVFDQALQAAATRSRDLAG